MIQDERTTFCDATAAFGTDVSQLVGNVMDTRGPPSAPNVLLDQGAGEPIYLQLHVDTAFSGGTSVRLQLVSDSTADLNTSRTVHIDTGAIAVGTLVAGYMVAIALPVQQTYERHLGLWLTTVGAVAAGKINAFLTNNPSAPRRYADAAN